MIPWSSGEPSMVWVLPLPVWPYAMMVPLMPFTMSCRVCWATLSYTMPCESCGVNTLSNLKGCLATITVFSSWYWMGWLPPLLNYELLNDKIPTLIHWGVESAQICGVWWFPAYECSCNSCASPSWSKLAFPFMVFLAIGCTPSLWRASRFWCVVGIGRAVDSAP